MSTEIKLIVSHILSLSSEIPRRSQGNLAPSEDLPSEASGLQRKTLPCAQLSKNTGLETGRRLQIFLGKRALMYSAFIAGIKC
jgi:hypothetical protein